MDVDNRESLAYHHAKIDAGTRIVGVRGDISHEFVDGENDETIRGFWKDLDFLISDGVTDSVIDIQEDQYASDIETLLDMFNDF